MDDNEAFGNYRYDLGYYEGMRNSLHMIITNLQNISITEKKKIDNLLFDIKTELDCAIESQKHSEKIFFDGY